MEKQFKIIFLVGMILSLMMVSQAYGFEKVIANSQDWKDVYSSMLYASLSEKYPGLFLTSSAHGTILLYSVSKDTNGTLIISSRAQPYIVNYKTVMESQGYKDLEEIRPTNINIELARRIAEERGIDKFIVVDDAYGYNALSIASYAALDKYYVLFATERNIGTVDSFLSDVDPTEVIIFGQVDEAVKARLAKYDPETINLGDRFDNNIEIAKRYQQIKHSKQALTGNGEFIEASIMSGQDPVIFIGRGNVPTQVADYIKQSEFEVAVLIGNELINSATSIRRQLGISVFVKFAQGARNPEGAIAAVEDLDKFPMPRYGLNLELYSILYNRATKSLRVTYRNSAAAGTYLKRSITFNYDDQTAVVGDQEPVFIDKNQYKTLIYDADLQGDNITASIYTLFGEGKRSLENVLEGTLQVESIEILDESFINITDVSYDKGKNQFLITIKNIGEVEAYVNVELIDLFINGEYVTVSAPENVLLKPGQSITLRVDVDLSDADIENNPTVNVKGYYGERENSLIKTVSGEYEMKISTGDIILYALIALVIILLALILLGKKKCPSCGTKNSRTRKKCRKCGHLMYSKRKEASPKSPS